MAKNRFLSYSVNIIITAVIVLFIFSSAVVLTLNFRPLYYHDIHALDIEAASGMDRRTITDNYDILIDYNAFYHTGELAFSDFPMSDSGQYHFMEVKRIFVIIQYTCILTLIILTAAHIYAHRKKKRAYSSTCLKAAAILSLLLPAAASALMAVNWENTFVFFHHMLFNNNYWLFDFTTDPVITILPDQFFMHCAIMIVILIIAESLITYILYRRQRPK